MSQFIFLGLLFDNPAFKDLKLQQLVPNNDDTNTNTAKTSQIEFWVVCKCDGKCIYFPISKIDKDNEMSVVPAQILNMLNDRSRRLVQKVDKGTRILPYGFIIN